MSPSERSRKLRTAAQLRHERIKTRLGSRVLNVKEELLSGHLAKAIRHLLEQRGVLVFPELHLSDEEHLAFTKTLRKGQSEPRSKIVAPASMGIVESWLSSKRLPCWGNSNESCTTYAAWEPRAEKKAMQARKPLRAMHSAWTSLFFYEADTRLAQLTGTRSNDQYELPVVRTQRVGCSSMALRRSAEHVVSLHATQSSQILFELREWATGEQFSYRHHWRAGDLVMWGRLKRATG